jgi:hypothetical protein
MMNPLPANRIQAGSQAGVPRINLQNQNGKIRVIGE